MKISKKEIYKIFHEADLEGLIGNGAQRWHQKIRPRAKVLSIGF